MLSNTKLAGLFIGQPCWVFLAIILKITTWILNLLQTTFNEYFYQSLQNNTRAFQPFIYPHLPFVLFLSCVRFQYLSTYLSVYSKCHKMLLLFEIHVYFLGLQNHCGWWERYEIKRHLLLRRKAITNLDSVLRSRGITLPAKVCLVKGMVFPVVMYGCESWP